MAEVRPGKYRHYKGNLYEVLEIARHTETLEEFVVYRALYDSEKFGKNALWVRPKAMFLETLTISGKKFPRFQYISE